MRAKAQPHKSFFRALDKWQLIHWSLPTQNVLYAPCFPCKCHSWVCKVAVLFPQPAGFWKSWLFKLTRSLWHMEKSSWVIFIFPLQWWYAHSKLKIIWRTEKKTPFQFVSSPSPSSIGVQARKCSIWACISETLASSENIMLQDRNTMAQLKFLCW